MNTLKYNLFVRIGLFFTSIIFQAIVLSDVTLRTVNNWSLFFWILSMVLLYFAFPFSPSNKEINRIHLSRNTFLIAFSIILFATFIRIILMLNINSFHIDEYLSAHFAYSLGDITKLDWFGIYPSYGDWIWKFPVLYFFFQKLFFNLFGLSTLTMRFSITPYIVLIFVFLFLLAKRLYNEKTAIGAILILAVFSPDLYLSRWSLLFISSTALFLATTYFFILSKEVGRKIHFAVFGFLLGTCYMTYYSSYIAAPLFIVYLLVMIITKKIPMSNLRNYIVAFGIFLYTISPFITYALKVDNFFTQRTQQVALINGLWSPYQNIVISVKSVSEILKKQTDVSIQSLYKDKIGGQGGYWFGKLALFDKTTFLFLVLSMLYLLFQIFRNKKAPQNIFLILTIICAFVTGIIFTIPPPAFHRFSIAFPFISLLIAVTITDLYMILKTKRVKAALMFFILFIAVVMIGNIIHFREILKTDGPDDPDFPKIQNDLNKENARMVYVASPHRYSLGIVLFIRSEKIINSVNFPLDQIIAEIPHDRTSYLVIVYPDEASMEKVKEVFPHAEIFNRYATHMLIKIIN